MSTLLIKNLDAVVTCDPSDSMPVHTDILIEDGLIRQIAPDLEAPEASSDRVIDGSGMVAYPGLVNAHHHLYQAFSRNLPEVQNLELFDWLVALYEVWKNLDEKWVARERARTEDHIMRYLLKEKSIYIKRCRYCGRMLPIDSPFNVCERCYARGGAW